MAPTSRRTIFWRSELDACTGAESDDPAFGQSTSCIKHLHGPGLSDRRHHLLVRQGIRSALSPLRFIMMRARSASTPGRKDRETTHQREIPTSVEQGEHDRAACPHWACVRRKIDAHLAKFAAMASRGPFASLIELKTATAADGGRRPSIHALCFTRRTSEFPANMLAGMAAGR